MPNDEIKHPKDIYILCAFDYDSFRIITTSFDKQKLEELCKQLIEYRASEPKTPDTPYDENNPDWVSYQAKSTLWSQNFPISKSLDYYRNFEVQTYPVI